MPSTTPGAISVSEVVQARANVAESAADRREAWLELAEIEGRTALGGEARGQALAALLEGATDRESALAALQTVDGAGDPTLRYRALPEDGDTRSVERTAALWALAESFSEGTWCEELAERLLWDGLDLDLAERFAGTCGTGGPMTAVIGGHARTEPGLRLVPVEGGGRVEVIASATDKLQVSQHRVDAAAMFRAGSGSTAHPLDTLLDAFLLEPDQAWEVPLDPARPLRRTEVRPRAAGPLTALTVRAGNERATALVLSRPLEVQVVRQGEDAAIAVLRAGQAVAGATLLVDDAGTITEARTGRDGIARVKITGAVRVMATSGEGLGFVTARAPGAQPPRRESWAVVLWDRAVPERGDVRDVQIFGTAASGAATPTVVTLRSTGRNAGALASQEVRMAGGVGHARIFVQGGGSLVVEAGGQMLGSTYVGTANASRAAASVTFSDAADPEHRGISEAIAGSTVLVHVAGTGTVPAGGIDATVQWSTPWSSGETAVVIGTEPVQIPVSLAGAGPDDQLSVELVVGGLRVDGHLSITQADLAGPLSNVPEIVGLGQAVAMTVPPGTPWLRATLGGRTQWFIGGSPVALAQAGEWALCAWTGGGSCGPVSKLTVVDPNGDGNIDARGAWTGAPVLAAHTAEGVRGATVLREGASVGRAFAGPARAGTAESFLVTGNGEAVPLGGATAPVLKVTGALVRGEQSTVTIQSEAGSRVWAYLRESGKDRMAGVAPLWTGGRGYAGVAWRPGPVEGTLIAAGLLAEEERMAEKSEMRRMDYGYAPGSDAMVGSAGASGYGTGGGGMGGKRPKVAYGGEGVVSTAGGFFGEPKAIGVVDGKAPGAFTFDVPAWISAADVEVVVQTRDGRWTSEIVPIAVRGPSPGRVPDLAEPTLRDTAAIMSPDGSTLDPVGAELLHLARALPSWASVHALAALAAADRPTGPVRGAATALAAAREEHQASNPDWLAEEALARHLLAARKRPTSGRPLGDPYYAARSLAALTLAGSDLPDERDRARIAADRLLQGKDLPAWVVARGALALWLAGDGADALTRLPDPDPARPADAATIAAVRTVISGVADPTHAARWWATARSEGAYAGDRALALHALSRVSGRWFPPEAAEGNPAALDLWAESPVTEWRGRTFQRSNADGSYTPGQSLMQPDEVRVPAGRLLPIYVRMPGIPLPTRLRCPDGSGSLWVEMTASLTSVNTALCRVRPREEGDVALIISRFDANGERIATQALTIHVGAPREAALTDPMSENERLELAVALSRSGDLQARSVLSEVIRTTDLPPAWLKRASEALLTGAVAAAPRADADPLLLIQAFQGFREHVTDGTLDLPAAAALAHAYGAVPEGSVPNGAARALSATRVVMDARFKEELAAVSNLRSAGLELTALKLLQELLGRYPETPTVVRARFLVPAMLLGRAEGDGDRLGYTRSSLRHTAAAELAGFLLLHPPGTPDATPETPEAGALLSDALHALGDPARERSLTALLATAFRGVAGAEDVSWRLSLADARAVGAAGQPAAALRILDGIGVIPAVGTDTIALERGRALEALGRTGDAKLAFAAAAAGEPEAADRIAWLDRTAFATPSLLVLAPGAAPVIPALLRPGTEVTVTAIAIALEAALLRDAGGLRTDSIHVDGLRPTASKTLPVGAAGDVPLPALPEGAYLVTITVGARSERLVVVRTDAELVMTSSGGGTLLHLTTTRGAPVPAAQLWLFDAAGTVQTLTTDTQGSAWSPTVAKTAVARRGDRYAMAQAVAVPTQNNRAPPRPAARPKAADEAAYDDLFRQDAAQKVQASGL